MARGKITYTVQDEGRDRGKSFVITELPASRAESWAMRALLALMSNGTDLPAGVQNMGMAAMAEIGIKALSTLRWEVAEPLLAEMWSCITVEPMLGVSRPLVEEDIEEVMTRVKLRAEVWKLHTGFLSAVVR